MVAIKQNRANKANYGSARAVGNIKYIVIHYTANDGDTDESNGKYFHNNVVKASAHYFVDSNSITQSVPDNYVAYAVGGKKLNAGGKLYGIVTNANSISVELCDDNKNGVIYPSSATIKNAVDLVKELMKKYKVPASKVVRHYDVTGKKCPAYWCGDATKNALWVTDFRNKLTEQGYVYGGVDYSLVFNPVYYANKNADVKKAFGTDAEKLFNHFIKFGMKEGRQAILDFNVQVYKERYVDLKSAFGTDLAKYYKHYCEYGKAEGRKGI